MRDLDEDQRHDREEEELPAHRRTVSGGCGKRNRPTGLIGGFPLLNRAAQEDGPSARSELPECPHEGDQKESEKPETENEVAAHRLTGRAASAVSSGRSGLPPLRRGTNQATERREARMYVGLGTILLIVLIIILLIWVF